MIRGAGSRHRRHRGDQHSSSADHGTRLQTDLKLCQLYPQSWFQSSPCSAKLCDGDRVCPLQKRGEQEITRKPPGHLFPTPAQALLSYIEQKRHNTDTSWPCSDCQVCQAFSTRGLSSPQGDRQRVSTTRGVRKRRESETRPAVHRGRTKKRARPRDEISPPRGGSHPRPVNQASRSPPRARTRQ